MNPPVGVFSVEKHPGPFDRVDPTSCLQHLRHGVDAVVSGHSDSVQVQDFLAIDKLLEHLSWLCRPCILIQKPSQRMVPRSTSSSSGFFFFFISFLKGSPPGSCSSGTESCVSCVNEADRPRALFRDQSPRRRTPRIFTGVAGLCH